MPPIEEWLPFIHTAEFDEDWEELGLDDEDLSRLQAEILENPDAGDHTGRQEGNGRDLEGNRIGTGSESGG